MSHDEDEAPEPTSSRPDGLFRSAEMMKVQFIIQNEAVHDVIEALGNLGSVMFNDLSPNRTAFDREFVHEVKRCDELARRCRFIEGELAKSKVKVAAPSVVVDGQQRQQALSLEDIETRLEAEERDLRQLLDNQARLFRNENAGREHAAVLQKCSATFDEARHQPIGTNAPAPTSASLQLEQLAHSQPLLEEPDSQSDSRFGHIAGVMVRDQMPLFERLIWRATRGNMYMSSMEIEQPILDPVTEVPVMKNVFLIFHQGDLYRRKIEKICDTFGATQYDFPQNMQERQNLQRELDQHMLDSRSILKQTSDQKRRHLEELAVHMPLWSARVKKEKAIYSAMNLFSSDTNRKCMVGSAWIPTSEKDEINRALREADARTRSTPSIVHAEEIHEQPPTYFRTNKFTVVFQQIVDAYGIANYGEMNPAVFTTVTFPFLFAVMFGDVGHGMVIFLFALWLLFKAKQHDQEVLSEGLGAAHQARYLLVLMGFFAVYNGLLYNECFAIPLNLFGSNWDTKSVEPGSFGKIINPQRTYPFGVDPVWGIAQNNLVYYNSLKMKLSIVFGVAQMVFGIGLSGSNAVYYRRWVDLVFTVFPQLIFMSFLFGYLWLIIFIKWFTDYSQRSNEAPALIPAFIQFFMSPSNVNKLNRIYEGQEGVQPLLVITAVIMLPIMLFAKPIVLKMIYNGKAARGELHPDAHGVIKPFPMGDLMTHNTIHTIEFVLGCISNTASYLRLWALSLAHSELSKVFYDKVLLPTAGMGWFALFIGFTFWCVATFGVIVLMESLSALLHALRLHWIEFQNKFYAGNGKPFKPFSFKLVLANDY